MFVELVFPLPFRNTFTYSVPDELTSQVHVGVRAVAPFGKRTLTGFVTKKSATTSLTEKIKPIEDIIDEVPVINETGLKFFTWLAEYYMCSLGEALRLAVPIGTEIESKRKIIIEKEHCAKLYQEEKNKKTFKAELLRLLSERDEISFKQLQRITKKKNLYSTIHSIEKTGAVTVLNENEEAKVKPKTVKQVKLIKSLGEVYAMIPELESRSPKQVKILLTLAATKGKPIPQNYLLKKTESSQSSLDSLESKGLIEISDVEVERKYGEEYKEKIKDFELTDNQKNVIEKVSAQIDENKFKVFLLHGVTGSGKTQVYIELVKKVLHQKKSALILVPEISLTPQMTARMFNNFGDKVSVVHSRMSPGERYDTWRRILKGKSNVVVGARSAMFSPIFNPGIVVVDEEHDASYKQFDSVPKYNGRDAAIVLASMYDCPVVIGSATPSVESMYNARSGKYELLNLPDRMDNAKLPVIELVNVSSEKKARKMENIFSHLLLNKIEDRLKKNEGVILLQNRRGFSTQVFCDDCGEIETCDNCSVSMTYHINKNMMQCHYCGLIKKVPNACTHCGSLSIKYYGTGTERVEDELAYYFPQAKINRVDSDSVSKKFSLGKILSDFGKGETDILVGTQMVSKGLDFSRVTLVGVIAAETTLWLPDFRADERTFQLLTQVAGRAGRSNQPGEVIIQTQNEKHFTLQRVVMNDYEGFYQKEIMDREKMFYPPFTRICLIEAKDLKDENAKGAINDFYNELRVYKKQLQVHNPTNAIISRLKGFYRYHILIKSSRQTDPGGAILRKAVMNAFVEFNKKSRYKDVKLFYDVDPQSVI